MQLTHTHMHTYTACLMLHVARIQAWTRLAWPGLAVAVAAYLVLGHR